MSKPKANYTELTHQVVRESPEPLPFAEIMARVAAITSITTRNPKGTIRNAVSQSRLIVATGDGRYGWLPRLITGSVLRLTLSEHDRAGSGIEFGEEVRDALWPTFFESQKRMDRSPVQAQLPDGTLTRWPLDFFGDRRWGTTASPEFWQWFQGQPARPGDHLIVTALDGEARRFGVHFQRRAERDEIAIAARNQLIRQAALDFVRRHPSVPPLWDIIPHLLATGQYRHPTPPDPLDEIWTPAVYEAEVIKKTGGYGGALRLVGGIRQEMETSAPAGDLVRQLFGPGVQFYSVDNPQDLPPEYQPGQRRPRPSPKARQGPVKTWTFRVNLRPWPDVWRDLELAEDQTLEDLHLTIQQAYGWGDDHLYSFFMSGRGWDRASEIGSPWSETDQHTHQVRLSELGLKPGDRFLYLFDYGDGHEFEVTVQSFNPASPPGEYPRLGSRRGRAPRQY